MSEPEILAWDRQEDEPEKAYGYFVLYRDLGRTRTVAKVATEVNKSRDYLHKLATRWKWVQRAQAWDREEDRLYVEGLAEQRRDMAKRHARIAGALQAKLVARLQSLDASKLSPADIARWLEVATRVERLALLCPGGIGRQRVGPIVMALLLKPFGAWGQRAAMRFVLGPGVPREAGEFMDYISLVYRYFRPRLEPLPVFGDDALRRLTMPVLATVGDRDRMLDSHGTRRRLLHAVPHATVDMLPGAGHMIIGRSLPILGFLRQPEGTRPNV